MTTEAKKLEAWMKKNNKTEVDVASLTRVNPRTVTRFLNTGKANRNNIARFMDLANSSPAIGWHPNKAVG